MVIQGKTIAIVSYITVIGLIIAVIMNQEKHNAWGKFHIKQALMITLASLVVGFIPFVKIILGVALFILWLIGLIYAIEGKKKAIPLLGKLAQDWFKGL